MTPARFVLCSFLTLGAFLMLAACGDAFPDPVRPNVLILVMDTTRGDRVSFNGYERPTTPKLDAFCATAVVFRDAWSPAGWTGPAHASLLTGLRPEHHGYFRGNREYLSRGFVTLAERFGAEGYETGCLTNNNVLSPESGLLVGFQSVAALYLDERRQYPWAPETHRQALEWVERAQARGKPFFLLVNDMEPHFPYSPPRGFESSFVPHHESYATVDSARRTHASELFAHNLKAAAIPGRRLRILSDLYNAEIATLDHSIGILLDRLQESGLLDSTIVVITGDHGENLGEHGLVDHMFSLHRTIRHVPLVIRYPPHFEGGRSVPDVVRLEDVAPTLLEFAGLEVPGGLDGVSLVRDLPGRIARATLGPPNSFLDRVGGALRPGESLAPLRARVRAIYDGRHHLIRYSDGRTELYDVADDPLETRDLATRVEYTDVLTRLKSQLRNP